MDYKEVLHEKLKSQFGFDNYKSKQQKKVIEVIYREILEDAKDAFINLPSGFGKSLCFQLPVMAKDNSLAIVVTPTLALAKNQVDYLRSINISAYFWNGCTSPKIKKIIKKDITSKKPKIKFLYVSPDLFISFHFKVITDKVQIPCIFVIDEVHCMSSWSHDFRSCYENISEIRKYFSDNPIIAISSTVTKKVKDDIFKILKNPLLFSKSYIRKNLVYDMKFIDSLQNPILDLKKFISESLQSTNNLSTRKENEASGIIFCKRENTEELIKNLSAVGVQTLNYNHRKTKDKLKALQAWSSGDCQIIVATSDLGLGISKPSVRFVVHWGVPKSIAHYYQESGRAGHDGNLSYCRVYCAHEEMKEPLKYAHSEIFLSDYHIMYQPTQLISLAQITQSLTQLKCRHAVFLSYFGQKESNCIDKCDVCINNNNTAQGSFKQLPLSSSKYESTKIPILSALEVRNILVKKLYLVPSLVSNDEQEPKKAAFRSQKIEFNKKTLNTNLIPKNNVQSLGLSALEVRNILVKKLYSVPDKSVITTINYQIPLLASNDEKKSKETTFKSSKIDNGEKNTDVHSILNKNVSSNLRASAVEIRNILVNKLYSAPPDIKFKKM